MPWKFKCIQKNIVDTVLEVTHALIKKQFEETGHLSIQVDETT